MRKEDTRMVTLLKNLLTEECGQDTLEYVFIGLIVALGAIAGMTKLATAINNEFSGLGGDLT
jgi:Flp pilus assembly pilin Flp